MLSNLPKLPGEDKRPRQAVSAEDLKSVGENVYAYNFHEGDTVTFEEVPQVFSQPVRVSDSNSTNPRLAYWLAVEKNGEASYISLSSLVRKDFHGKPVGKTRELFCREPNFLGYYNKYLKGKTFTIKQEIKYQIAVFDDLGNRTKESRETSIYEIPLD